MNTIKFFNESNIKYYFLSNFYKCKIIYDNKIYDSSEHLYQCWKFISFTLDDINTIDNIQNINFAELIRIQSTPYKAKLIANQKIKNLSWSKNINDIIIKYKNVKIRNNFDEIKDDIMYETLKLKFNQNIELQKQLINTFPNILIENSPYDSYWGNANNGLNKLGILLMKLRDEYIN